MAALAGLVKNAVAVVLACFVVVVCVCAAVVIGVPLWVLDRLEGVRTPRPDLRGMWPR